MTTLASCHRIYEAVSLFRNLQRDPVWCWKTFQLSLSFNHAHAHTHMHTHTDTHTHTQSLMPRAIFLLARGLLWTPHKTASECTRSTWNTSLIRGGLLSSAWVLLYSHSRCFINQFFPSCAFRNKQTRKTRNLRR